MGRVPEPEPDTTRGFSATQTRTRKNQKIKPDDTILNTY